MEPDAILEQVKERLRMKHVVVVLNKGFGDKPDEITLRPRDGERLEAWGVSQKENTSMVAVWAVFRAANDEKRQQEEWFNSFRLDRVYAEGDE